MSKLLRTALFQIVGLFVIVGCFEAGKWLSFHIPLNLPAPLLGLLLLFIGLVVFKRVPEPVQVAGSPLLNHMSLFFVPAIMGVWHFREILMTEWPSFVASIVVSTILAFALVSKLADRFTRPKE
ncbi:CidA/LrgA family protein [Alteromonas facilis]|uniref:CidA/LrgA family protein n=1 Tax=Alteromonas facilis TaxID=2048004 RepID=UPI000C28DF40|nr:CidA/LrgA family protein [Alteromonas facilis]